MTRADAQSELSRLEPLETAAWTECMVLEAHYIDELKRLEAERLVIKENCDAHAAAARQVWLPMHKRKQQLKNFLEVSS